MRHEAMIRRLLPAGAVALALLVVVVLDPDHKLIGPLGLVVAGMIAVCVAYGVLSWLAGRRDR
jgi:peptidoglycan/LPS O-acetylase OafA/YrhL